MNIFRFPFPAMNAIRTSSTFTSLSHCQPFQMRRPLSFVTHDNQLLYHDTLHTAIPQANTNHHTLLNTTMSGSPSSPAFHDPQAHFIQEIKDLKAKLHKTLTSALDAKETELKGLRDYIDHNNKEYEETSQENEKLRRQSSTFEKIVVANEKELRSVATLESAIEDREAEVRQFTIDLATLKTERDDKNAEVKGLEGDIAELTQELESRDAQIELLLQKLSLVEQHIGCSPDLAVEELDEVLYEHMEKWTAMQADGPSRPASTKKSKRASFCLSG
jgi:predicted  nucleic acid-binding Zn-ribbon protein